MLDMHAPEALPFQLYQGQWHFDQLYAKTAPLYTVFAMGRRIIYNILQTNLVGGFYVGDKMHVLLLWEEKC